jgi:hypothetical protein
MCCCTCPAVLVSLLALADSSKPAKLQEAVADSLCALAAQDWTRTQLIDAGETADLACAPVLLLQRLASAVCVLQEGCRVHLGSDVLSAVDVLGLKRWRGFSAEWKETRCVDNAQAEQQHRPCSTPCYHLVSPWCFLRPLLSDE